MKTPRVILVTILFGLLASGIFYVARIPKAKTTMPLMPPVATPSPSNASIPKHASSLPLVVPPVLDARRYNELNDQPIEFYGKVVDQFGAPVSMARARGQILYDNGIANGVKFIDATTGSDGKFQISGQRGMNLSFSVEKKGFQFLPEGKGYEFTKLIRESERHHPDPEKPVELRMWKLQGAEPIIPGGKLIRANPDGRKIRFDFRTGRITETDGDIIFTLQYDFKPNVIPKTFEWKAEISVEHGGLIEADQRIDNMLLAPEGGYTPTLVFNFPARSAKWASGFTKNFYVKTSKNLHIRLQVVIQCDSGSPTGDMRLVWLMNPSGSRNLEYDDKLRIKPN